MFVQTGRLDRTDRDDPAVMNLDAISKFPSRRFGLLQTWLIVLKVNLLYRKRDCKHEDQPGLLPVSPSQKSSKVSQRAKIVVQLVSCKIMLQSPRLRFSSTFLKMKKLLFPLKNGFRDVACTACTLAEKVATSSDIGSTAARSLRVASLLGIHHQANQEVRCNLDVPQIRSLFLAKAKILVMQPRRIAATTLAVGVPVTTHLFVGVSNPKSGYYLTL